ncbi:hypothetical protein KSP40_PGU010616 [Platanthera guangdongensis]|uniref:Transposase (putative) gypsy type domain-containing protein n=1 Tax=Platanthera guangdongensis TaxID=2320717 RepID=A0ABR2LRR5_9ASPA
MDKSINHFSPTELAIRAEHFEVGLHCPIWSEVRQTLRYFGVVPAQLNPNSIALLVTFICYLREERIEFSLPFFRKLFNFRANRDGIAFFSGNNLKVKGLANKNHH